MRFSTQRRIDYVIGEPLCGLLDLGVRLLGAVLQRDHRLSPDFRRVWIIKFVGLGTIVNALPLLRAMRRNYLHAEITFVTFPGTLPLVSRLPEVNHVRVLRDHSLGRLAWDSFALILAAWRERPELIVDLEVHSRFSTLLSTLSMARNRAGFYHSTALFRSGLYTHLMFFNRFAHILECHHQLGRMIGCEEAGNKEDLLPISAEEEQEARQFLQGIGVSQPSPVVLVNCNAGPLCEERRWPLSKFALLTEALVGRFERRVILIGAPSEAASNEALRNLVNERLRDHVHNAAGRLTFGGTLALIRCASLLVTNDSGPLHLAAALETPTVSLWGPGAAQTYAPRGERHRAVAEPIYCSPCLYMVDEPPCAGDNQCLKRLAVSKVLAAALDLLGLSAGEQVVVPEAGEPTTYLPGYVARKSVAAQ